MSWPSLNDPLNRILLLFAITQLLGIACGLALLSMAQTNPDVQYLSVAPTGQADDWINAVVFIAYVLFGAVFAILLIRFFKRKIAFRLLEFCVLAGSVSVVFLAAFIGLLHLEFWSSVAASGLAGLAFAALKFFMPALKNTAAVLSSAGVAALFGFSLGFWPAVLFVLGLSLYDYIAVFKTRHMLQLAQHLGEKDLSFTITAESPQPTPAPAAPAPASPAFSPPASAPAPTLDSLRPSTHPAASASRTLDSDPLPASAARVPSGPADSASSPAASRPPLAAPSQNPAPSSLVDRLDLGSGDLAIPAMLAVSTSTLAGLPGALAVALGSTVALYLTLRLVIERRVALPALPPICLGGLCALLLWLVAAMLAGL